MSRCKLIFTCSLLYCVIAGTWTATPEYSTIAEYAEKALLKKGDDLYHTLINTDRTEDFSVTEMFREKLGTIRGTVASSFRSFGQSFLLSDSDLKLITFNKNLTVGLKDELQIKPSSEVLFIESVEWKDVLFLLLAYKNGMLQLLRASGKGIYKDHKISCCDEPAACVPEAAEFFSQDDKLYLVLITKSPAAKPLIIYEWKTTDLDRLDSVDGQLGEELVSPTSLATFPAGEGTAIVVGRSKSSARKGGLSLFLMKQQKLQFLQVIDADGIIGLLPFFYHAIPHVLALTDASPSLLFLYNGKQLSSQTSVPEIFGVKLASVGYVNGTTFLLMLEKEYVQFFTPAGRKLNFIASLAFPAEIHSATMHMYEGTIFLVVIWKEDGVLTPYVLKLKISFPGITEHLNIPADELVGCLRDLATTLHQREGVLNALQATSTNLLLRNKPARLSGRLVVNAPNKIVLRNGVLPGTVRINPQDYNLTATPTQLQNIMALKIDTAKQLQESLKRFINKNNQITWSSEQMGPLKLANLKASSAYVDTAIVSTLNSRTFAPQNILTYSTNQAFAGAARAKDVYIDRVYVNTVSGMKVEDLLLNSGHQQVVNIKEVSKVTAGTLTVTSGDINGIRVDEVVRKSLANSTMIRGKKEVPGLLANELIIGSYNTVNLETWWNSLRARLNSRVKRQIHVKSDLIVKNLTVDNVNGIELNKLLNSLFVLGGKQEIRGTLRFATKPTFTNVLTQTLNGIPSSNLLTISSDQVVNGTASFGALSASEIFTNYVNKFDLARDVARLDSPTVFDAYVAFQNALFVKDLRLPLSTQMHGRPLPPHLLKERRQVYKKPVRITGSLNVYNLGLQKNKFIVGGMPLSIKDLLSLYWTKSTPQNIVVPVSAKSPLSAKALSVDIVNGVPVGDILHCDTLNALPGSWHVPSAVVIGDVQHLPGAYTSAINPRHLYESIVFTSGNYTVKGRKVFTGGVSVRHLRANTLDQVDPINVLLKKSSVIPGSNSWNKIWIKKDLIIQLDLTPDRVNNVNLCETIENAVKTDEYSYIKSMVMNTVVAEDVRLAVLNGVPLNTRSKRSEETPYLKKLIVKGSVSVPDLRYVTTVNNIPNLREFLPYVVNKTVGAVIEGYKSFPAQVVVEQYLSTTTVNQVRLNDFVANLLSRTNAQQVSAFYTMKSAEAAWLSTWEVNNVEIGKLVTRDSLSQQMVHGNLRFLEGLRVGDLKATNLFRGCDIKQVVASLTHGRRTKWDSVQVDGDVTWTEWRDVTSQSERGLGFLLQSAVTTTGPHSIFGAVTFAAPVEVVDIESEKDIDDVALDYITRDALLKDSPTDQIINAPIRFLSDINATFLEVYGNIDVAVVNDISILAINGSIVRKSRSEGAVTGTKYFTAGMEASTVITGGLLNGLVTSMIVNYDAPRLPPVDFTATLTVTENLTFVTVNDLNVTDLLTTRVTLDTPQTIRGNIKFAQDVDVTDRASFANVNNVDVASVVTLNNPNTQTIYGPKEFSQDLVVHDRIDLGDINGVKFSSFINEALRKDQEARIAGSVTFTAPITVDTDVFIDRTVNGITLNELQHRLQTVSVRYPKREPLLRQIRVAKQLVSMRSKSQEVLYLDTVENLKIRVSNMSRVVVHKYHDEVGLDVYGSEYRQCGLPEDCRCPVQMSIRLGESNDELVASPWKKILDRSFTFDDSDTTIKVISTTVSRSTKCRVSPEQREFESTKVTWMRPSRDPIGNSVWISADSQNFRGYVSDVAYFRHEYLAYVVIGFSYDAVSDTTNLNSKVVRLDYGNHEISLAQEIPTYGVSSLNVFSYLSTPHLVVGNSYDSNRRTSEVPLCIYKYNPTTYKLDMLKKIPTVGVVAVATLVEGGDSIIVVAQAQTNAPVLVFKFDHLIGNYKVIQQISDTAVPTGLAAFTIADGFVGLAAPDRFRLYKYCHVQGLKLVQEYRKIGVRGFALFSLSQHYLFLTSVEASSLLKLVVQGG